MRSRSVTWGLSLALVLAAASGAGAQTSTAAVETRREFGMHAGVVPLDTGAGRRQFSVLGMDSGFSDVAGEWLVGGNSRLWFTSHGPDAGAAGLGVYLRVGRMLAGPALEGHVSAGLGLATVSGPASNGYQSGFAYELGLTHEMRVHAGLGVIVSADLVAPPHASHDPRAMPMLAVGVGLRRHQLVQESIPGDAPPRRWPWPGRPRPPVTLPL